MKKSVDIKEKESKQVNARASAEMIKKEMDLLNKKQMRYRSLFYESPVSLWEEDWSLVKSELKRLSTQGVSDFHDYFYKNPTDIYKLISSIKIHSMNKSSMRLFNAKSMQDLLIHFEEILPVNQSYEYYRDLIVARAKGSDIFQGSIVGRAISGEEKHLNVWNVVVEGSEESFARIIVGFIDVTKERKGQELLKEQKQSLEQKNIALRELLEQIEIEKQKLKQDILKNLEDIVLPLVDKLKIKNAKSGQIDLLRSSLEDLTSSFGRKIADKKRKLSPREVEIANMLKEGLSSKEIANMLSVSVHTVEKHRLNIRKKLGINKKEFNLTTFLREL